MTFSPTRNTASAFRPASIDATTLFGSGGDASYQTYCKAHRLCALSPALDRSGASVEHPGALAAADQYGGGLVRRRSSSSFLTAIRRRRPAPCVSRTSLYGSRRRWRPARSNPPPIMVCQCRYFVADQGVTYANSGTPLTYIGASAPTATGTYGMTPTGTYLFAAGDRGTNVEIAYQYQIAASFVPNVTPIYDLADDDYQGREQRRSAPGHALRSVPGLQRLAARNRRARQRLHPDQRRVARPERDRALRHAHRPDGDARTRSATTNVAADLRPAHAAAGALYPQHLQVPAVLGISACSIRWTWSRSPMPFSACRRRRSASPRSRRTRTAF